MRKWDLRPKSEREKVEPIPGSSCPSEKEKGKREEGVG